MLIGFTRRGILAALLAVLALALAAAPVAGQTRFATSSLTIETKTGSHKFTVELAITESQQERGLMFRRRLAPDAGMLFVHQAPERSAMWMKNTLIPLDMLFIAADGTIAKIAASTIPLSETTITSGGPVIAVLELNGGTASRLGIHTGDRVVSPELTTAK